MHSISIYKNNLIILLLLFSPGIHIIASSRYGIRVEQLLALGFIVAIFPLVILKYSHLIKKEFLVLLSFLFFLPFALLTTTNLTEAIGPVLGILRFSAFGILGYLLIKNFKQYDNLIVFIWKIGLVYLFISYLQHYNVFYIGDFFFKFYNGNGVLWNYQKLPSTTFGIAEYTARFLVFSFIFTFLLYKSNKFVKSIHYIGLIGLFIFMFIFSESRGTLGGVLFIIMILLFTQNKRFTYNTSFILMIISIVIIVMFYDYLINSGTPLDSNMITRLKSTWLKPLIDMSSSFETFIFGVGLQERYGDGSFTARLGHVGILGFIAFYFPILYAIVKIKNMKEDNFYLNVFFFSTIALLVSNVTYQAFDTGKQADIYWFMLGATYKYMYLKRGNSHETIHSIS